MAIGRRALLGGAGLAAIGGAGAGWAWWHGGNDPVPEADLAARTPHDLHDRGLVPVAQSGWTMPGGEAEPWPLLEADLEADVAVVGAGLAGSSLALHLAEAGRSVVLVEARQPGWGASGRNAGHVLPTLRDPSVFEAFADRGRAFLEAFGENRGLPFDLARRHGIACDAVRSGYVNAAAGRDDIAKFRAGTAWMEERGLLAVHEVGGEDLRRATGTAHWGHALVYDDGGHINPYRFTNGMVRAAAGLGARVFGNSAAQGIEPAGNCWRLRTARGSVTADRVVFCTNAYATDVVPEFATAFYPLTAYGLTTRPLPAELRDAIMPSRMVLSQVPLDLNPLVRDEHDRLVLSSIPSTSAPEDAAWHFRNQREWLHRVWPEARGAKIAMETYWTGRVALRDREFPGVFQVQPGLYGLMFFNAWGNLMAPLMGKLLAQALAADRMDRLPFPLEKPVAVANRGKQDRIIRHLLLPAARLGQDLGLL